MTRRVWIGLTMLLGALLASPPGLAQKELKKDAPTGPAPPGPPAPVVRLAEQAKLTTSALKYSLLPNPLDQVDGNAAPIWISAALAARSVRHKWTDKEWAWHGPGPEGTSLDKFPRKEVQAVLDKHAAALRLIDQAALRSRCDWGRPPLTIQNMNDLLLGDEVQGMRELANLLSLRCRLALAEKDFDLALRSLRAGFTLVRHVGQSDMMIQDLVGLALAMIMLGRVEEWIQVPGSPNLYWPLTDLPRPLIDVRRSIRNELGTIYRSFPPLRELKTKKLSAEEARVLVEKFFELVGQLCGQEQPPGWLKKFSTAGLALTYYPVAKKGLIARGRSAKEVDAMPAVHAVAVYYLEEFDQTCDDILKWLAVPGWQGHPQLEKLAQSQPQKAKDHGNMLIAMLLPALVKVRYAQLRTDRIVAGLRGAEALRLYAAAHGGKPPARWADVTEVPEPTDPFTGKGIGNFYKLEGNTGVLAVPPPPGQQARLGRRFELPNQP